MKDFMRYTLATVVGLFLFSIVCTVMCIISVAGMVASDSMTSPVEDNSILKISLNGNIDERAQETPWAEFMGENMGSTGLDDMLQAIEKAKESDKIKGIYIEGGATMSATPAMLQELRQALLEFKKSGKWIVAYGDTYSQGSYYVASVADKVMVNPQGGIDWHGLASEPMFFKDVLAKVGVKMQVYKVGTYKSAVEPFTSSEMSEANREQVTSYLSSIWGNMTKEVAQSRKMKVDELNTLADSFMVFHPATELITSHLADKTAYIDEVRDYLRKKMDLDEDDMLNFVSVTDMASAETLTEKHDDEIAVYYAYGDIVDDRVSGLSAGTEANISADAVTEDLKALREDEDVKAVVIRVNSGGGSAYASEQIWHEIELLKAAKPVVVSMGGMAASGGYYISSGANLIYAEPTTLTGSIGIFGMFPDVSELMTQKIGIKYDVVKTNALSDFGSQARPFNADESRLIQAEINRGYETFTGRVAMGRKMKIDAVKAIAEGRVWTGEQAIKIGLVDRLGNLNDAITAAAKLAKSEEYNIGRYPAPTPWYENLMNEKKSGYLESQLRTTLGEYYTTFSLVQKVNSIDHFQMRLPFDPNIH